MMRDLIDKVKEGLGMLTEGASSDPRRVYRMSMCDAMALALQSLTGLPLGLWRGFFPDEFGDEGDEAYEDCHAVVVVSFDPPKWIDVDGLHDGLPEDSQFGQPVDRIELVPASKRDVRQAFTAKDFDPAIVQQAKRFVEDDLTLSQIVASYRKKKR